MRKNHIDTAETSDEYLASELVIQAVYQGAWYQSVSIVTASYLPWFSRTKLWVGMSINSDAYVWKDLRQSDLPEAIIFIYFSLCVPHPHRALFRFGENHRLGNVSLYQICRGGGCGGGGAYPRIACLRPVATHAPLSRRRRAGVRRMWLMLFSHALLYILL